MRLGLVGAGIADLPGLPGLLDRLKEAGTQVSLSSLRADRVEPELLTALAAHGQRTVTLASESFSPHAGQGPSAWL